HRAELRALAVVAIDTAQVALRQDFRSGTAVGLRPAQLRDGLLDGIELGVVSGGRRTRIRCRWRPELPCRRGNTAPGQCQRADCLAEVTPIHADPLLVLVKPAVVSRVGALQSIVGTPRPAGTVTARSPPDGRCQDSSSTLPPMAAVLMVSV